MQPLHERILNRFENRKGLFLLFLFITAFFFRSPTLFNDFYASDELAAIVQAKEYLAGEVPWKDFHESKKPLYHLIFKASYSLSEDLGWVYVHFITILIVFLTSMFIYLTGREIFNARTGMLASLFYAALISSFNTEFMATNGEIIYNLPLAAGFYFFICFLSKPAWRPVFFLLSLLMCWGAYMVKFHGIILLVYMTFFFAIYQPFYKGKLGWKIAAAYGACILFVIGVFFWDYFFIKKYSGNILFDLKLKLDYAIAQGRGFTPLHFFSRFFHRQSLFALWHMVLWVPAGIFFYRFMKNKCRLPSISESALALYSIITYLMVFGGGARLYYHYFMAAYPALAIVSASAILGGKIQLPGFIARKAGVLLLVPGLFFFTWNVKDAVIRNFFPGAFYNEGPVLFWARAVLAGTYNNYLLPNPVYADAAAEIARLTKKGDRIFVWGDGPDLYYFSNRRMGGYTLFPKNSIYLIDELYKKGDEASVNYARALEGTFIIFAEKKQPAAIIDTSGSRGMQIFQTRIIDQALFKVPLTAAKDFYPYILSNYEFAKEVNNIRIYLRKDNRGQPPGRTTGGKNN